MDTLTHDQALTLLDAWIPTVVGESRTTRNVLAAVPVDQGDYRPAEHCKTAMELVRHIAVADNRFVEGVLTGTFPMAGASPAEWASPAEVADWYAAQYAANIDALSRATPEQLVHAMDFRGMFKRPAVMFLMIGLHHTIHHRGQLSSYLRPMGAKVPAIYGESYDSAALKASQAS